MNTFAKLYLAAVVAVATPVLAFAHAHLVSSDPAVGATVSAASSLKMTFSEGIEVGLSKFEVTDAKDQPVADAKASLDPASDKLVSVQFKSPLAAGTYKVHWHVVSVDTHRTEGTYTFTVKP